MNGIKGKLWVKFTVIIVFVVSVVFAACSSIALLYIADQDAFFDDGNSIKSNVLRSSLSNKMYNIVDSIGFFEPFGSKEAKEDEDIAFKVSDIYTESNGFMRVPIGNRFSNDQVSQSFFQLFYKTEYNDGNTTDVFTLEDGTITVNYQNLNLPKLSSQYFEDLEKYMNTEYSRIHSNLAISIINGDGECIYSNFSIANSDKTSSRDIYVRLISEPMRIRIYFDDPNVADSFLEAIQYCQDIKLRSIYRYDYTTVEIDCYLYYEDRITINVSVPEVLTVKDDIYIRVQKVSAIVENRYLFIVLLSFSIVAALASFTFLMCAAGYSEHKPGISLNFFDRIPLEVHIGISILLAAAILNLNWYYDEFWIIALEVVASIAVAALDFILLLMTISARCKAGRFIKNTIILGFPIYLISLLIKYFKSLKYGVRFAIAFFGFFIYDIICIIAMTQGNELGGIFDGSGGLFAWIIGKIFEFIIIIRYAIGLATIRQGCKRISEGNTDSVISKDKMPNELKDFADEINSIGNGIQLAVEDRIKSERLKTELITNVSHDLKTPLTSIVNYVDILSREDIKPESAKEYVEVLVRQSLRMKKLIDDLVEASKASSGVIPINLQRTDLSLLLTQAAAEYEERFENAALVTVLDLPENQILINADGRLMWRVLDNLMGNIVKYAMPGTRVYISAYVLNGIAYATFKNISRYALNISSEDLMERFVRGDSSRHTEGSGLGLSIAKSLCALQNVDFDISIDGDLFKAEISLPVISEEDELHGFFELKG